MRNFLNNMLESLAIMGICALVLSAAFGALCVVLWVLFNTPWWAIVFATGLFLCDMVRRNGFTPIKDVRQIMAENKARRDA